MMNSAKTKILSILLLFLCIPIFGQQTRLELADKYFSQFAYNSAIRLYEGAEKRGNKDWKIYAKLGDCYYNTSRPEEAVSNYERAIERKKKINTSYLLKYALSLRSCGASQDMIIDAFQEYYDKIGKKEKLRVRTLIDDPELKIENLEINSEFSDFGSFIYDDVLYFSSSRENPTKKKRINRKLYKWNEQPFLDIYSAKIDRTVDSLRLIAPIDSTLIDINTVAHESAVAINEDGTTMYFSGGAVDGSGKLIYNKSNTSILNIHRARFINNRWTIVEEDKADLEFLNYDLYSMGSPSLSPDNKRLFFVTCAPFPDAKGQTDIYYIDIKEDGSYGDINAVPGINTSYREGFPYVSSEGDLYFSSDGIYDDQLSVGLLDIYKVEDIDRVISKEIEAENVKIEHLESPINSDKDDFSYYIDEYADESNPCEYYAYFSSNRDFPTARGDDDIYRVRIKKPKTINGKVTDSSNQKPLREVFVHLIDSAGVILKTVQTDSEGNYNLDVECDQFYRLRASKTYFNDDLKEFNSGIDSDNINLELAPYPCEITSPIGFDFGSDLINVKEKFNLLKILKLLLSDPEVKIKIESHTDSRGSDENNQDLSERRAENTKQYLIDSGVLESQILSVTGFGESCPLYSDEEINNSPQKERETKHAQNRRTRFILSICDDDQNDCNGPDRDN